MKGSERPCLDRCPDGRGESCGGCAVASQYSCAHAPFLQAALRFFRGQRTPDARARQPLTTVCSICLISEVEKTTQGIKKISCSLVMFFCYSCYIIAHFFPPQVKCVSVCVCVYTYIPGRGFSLGALMILAPNHYPQRPAWEPRE